jgi:vacuolar-type H+-ATPase subunit D/Vma8
MIAEAPDAVSRLELLRRTRAVLASQRDELRQRAATVWNRVTAAHAVAADAHARAACEWAEWQVLAGEVRAANVARSVRGASGTSLKYASVARVDPTLHGLS